MTILRFALLLGLLCVPRPAAAQDATAQDAPAQDAAPTAAAQDPAAVTAPAAPAETAEQGAAAPESFDDVESQVQARLETSIQELARLREQIAAEQIPLSRRLNELESELTAVRDEYNQTTRLLDSRTLDLSNLKNEIKRRQDETEYLSGLLGDYLNEFESRLHIAEVQRYEEALEAAKLAAQNTSLSEQEVFAAQAEVLQLSLQRLEEALGGARFEGTAVDADGLVREGTFVLVGPAALFRSAEGGGIGTAEQRLGSLEPAQIGFGDELDAQAALALVAGSAGEFPLDATLGDAHKVESTQEPFLDHVKKGGPVMIPIFALAGASLLVALLKWLGMIFTRRPSNKKVQQLLGAVGAGDEERAQDLVATMPGPMGRMLRAGVEHIREPRELVEEVMYETVLTTRLKLQRFLPFIAISAASAPLLGLLGTVTGIINTFKMITIFGSGDVKSLSGGISEALITTKFGLIVAIPSLLLHAFLSRKAKGAIDRMEKSALAFANQVGLSASARPDVRNVEVIAAAGPDPELVRKQVNEILSDLMGPLVDERGEQLSRTRT